MSGAFAVDRCAINTLVEIVYQDPLVAFTVILIVLIKGFYRGTQRSWF